MSHTYDTEGALGLGTYTGPASEGPDRKRWQFTVMNGSDVAVLTRGDAEELVRLLMESLDYCPACDDFHAEPRK